ncbi:Long-chain-fatty-acid--CoA ligase 3-like protein, partial [Dinothrombium tinctorium]
MASAATVILLGLIKTIILLYDIITFPIYALIQKPWHTLKLARRVRAVREDPKDPYSPYVRVEETRFELVPRSMMNAETIGEVFKQACELYAKKRCYGFREVFAEQEEMQPSGKVFRKLVLSDNYTWVTYEEVDKELDHVVKGFLANGIKSGDRVVIFAETRPEWMVTANALFRMGSKLVTLYATLGDDGVVHGINESEASVVITSADLVPKLAKLESRLKNVKTIIYMESFNRKRLNVNDSVKERFHLLSFNEVIREGKKIKDEVMEEQIVPPKSDDIALFMYTSGSTGNPKAVMITHKNFLHGFQSLLGTLLRNYNFEENEIYFGYLPLAHILELISESIMFLLGIPIAFSNPQTMTDSATAVKKGCKGDISIAKPTIMPAVPLILDRIRKTVSDNVRKKGEFVEQLFEFAMQYKTFWTKRGFRTPIINYLVFRHLSSMMGGRLKILLVGGAPLSPDTQNFIGNVLNTKIVQGYAATECTAAATIMNLDDFSFGRVGAPLYGVKLRLVDWPEGNYYAFDKPNPRGEIVIGGNAVTPGYYNNEEETKKAYVDEDGVHWWYTGDIGEVFEDGTLKIIDRKKDLVK